MHDLARREAASAASAGWAGALVDGEIAAYATDLELARTRALG